MSVVLERGDLFICIETGKYIAHAISGDYVMEVGLAKKINERKKVAKELFKKFDFSVPGEHIGKALKTGRVFNLVVKEEYNRKANAGNIYLALCSLRDECEKEGIKDVYMPQICCGKEGLSWDVVSCIIKQAFGETDVCAHILISEGKYYANDRRKAQLFDQIVADIQNQAIDNDEKKEKLKNLGLNEIEIANILITL